MNGEETLTTTLATVQELKELFRRRLLDDRDKRLLVDDLHDRVRRAEEGMALEYLLPLIYRLMLVIDRIDGHTGPDTGFVTSLRTDLLQAFEQHGVESITHLGPVDPNLHEVVAVDGAPPGRLTVTEVRRRGYRYAGRLLRPAQVAAAHLAEDPSGHVG